MSYSLANFSFLLIVIVKPWSTIKTEHHWAS